MQVGTLLNIGANWGGGLAPPHKKKKKSRTHNFKMLYYKCLLAF